MRSLARLTLAVKLADYGLAHRTLPPKADGASVSLIDPPNHHARGGTVPYAAPEVLLGPGGCTSSDLFSLGVLTAEVCSRRCAPSAALRAYQFG